MNKIQAHVATAQESAQHYAKIRATTGYDTTQALRTKNRTTAYQKCVYFGLMLVFAAVLFGTLLVIEPWNRVFTEYTFDHMPLPLAICVGLLSIPIAALIPPFVGFTVYIWASTSLDWYWRRKGVSDINNMLRPPSETIKKTVLEQLLNQSHPSFNVIKEDVVRALDCDLPHSWWVKLSELLHEESVPVQHSTVETLRQAVAHSTVEPVQLRL